MLKTAEDYYYYELSKSMHINKAEAFRSSSRITAISWTYTICQERTVGLLTIFERQI